MAVTVMDLFLYILINFFTFPFHELHSPKNSAFIAHLYDASAFYEEVEDQFDDPVGTPGGPVFFPA